MLNLFLQLFVTRSKIYILKKERTADLPSGIFNNKKVGDMNNFFNLCLLICHEQNHKFIQYFWICCQDFPSCVV